MRRYGLERSSGGVFRGTEWMRLLTGIVMLAVIAMLIVRARDPDMWRAVVPSSQTGSKSGAPPQPTSMPKATGPTDEDAKESAAAREEYQAITDGATTLGPEEMEAYSRLVRWVHDQSWERLERRAKKGLRYTDLYDDVSKHRGELVALDVDIRAAGDAGKSRDGIALCDAWGATEESRGRLYSLIIVDYPPKMPTGYNIRVKAKFAGYLLKLQGYQPGSAKPGQKPEKAPLLIGRVQWEPGPVATSANSGWQEWIWVFGLVAVLAVGWGFHWIYAAMTHGPPIAASRVCSAGPGEVISIEQWLDEAGFSEDTENDA